MTRWRTRPSRRCVLTSWRYSCPPFFLTRMNMCGSSRMATTDHRASCAHVEVNTCGRRILWHYTFGPERRKVPKIRGFRPSAPSPPPNCRRWAKHKQEGPKGCWIEKPWTPARQAEAAEAATRSLKRLRTVRVPGYYVPAIETPNTPQGYLLDLGRGLMEIIVESHLLQQSGEPNAAEQDMVQPMVSPVEPRVAGGQETAGQRVNSLRLVRAAGPAGRSWRLARSRSGYRRGRGNTI